MKECFFFSALKQIRTNLNHSHHKRALAVLKAAMITWPNCDIFATTELSTEQGNERRYIDRLTQVLPFKAVRIYKFYNLYRKSLNGLAHD